jgi:hypothetical protein
MQATMVAIDDIIQYCQDKYLDFTVIHTAVCPSELDQNYSSIMTNPMSHPVAATSRNISQFRNIQRKRPPSEIVKCIPGVPKEVGNKETQGKAKGKTFIRHAVHI